MGIGVWAFRRMMIAAVVLVGSVVLVTRAEAGDPPDRKLAQRMVFELTVKYSENQVGDLVQPGFLVGKNGMGVTSYNALHGAKSVTGKFFGDDNSYKVDLLRAEPGLDVALVRLIAAVEGKSREFEFLELSAGVPSAGEAVWTLQASPTLDEAKAIASSVQIGPAAPAGAKSGMPFDAPGWILSEGRVDRRASGCPLVDENGRVVGINVWAWPSGKTRPLGLSARVISDLLTAYGDDVEKAKLKGQSAPTISLAEATQKFHDKKLNGSIYPRINWTGAENMVQQAREAAGRLDEDVTCHACDGKGTSTVQTRTDTTRVGRQGTTSYGTKTEKCKGCNGDKVPGKEKLGMNCARAAAKMARIAPGSADFDDVLKNFAESAKKIQNLAAGAFSRNLNEDARERLVLKRLRRGEAMMFVGTISRDAGLTAWESDMAVLTLPGATNVRILGVAPDDAGRLGDKSTALVVGVISGVVTTRGGEDWIVLDRVMVAPFGGAR